MKRKLWDDGYLGGGFDEDEEGEFDGGFMWGSSFCFRKNL